MSVSPPPGSAAVIDIASSDSDEEQQQSRKWKELYLKRAAENVGPLQAKIPKW